MPTQNSNMVSSIRYSNVCDRRKWKIAVRPAILTYMYVFEAEMMMMPHVINVLHPNFAGKHMTSARIINHNALAHQLRIMDAPNFSTARGSPSKRYE